MVANRKVTGRSYSMPAGIALGVLASVAVTLLLCALLTWIFLGEKIDDHYLGYGVMLTLLCASAIGALIGVGCIKRRRLLVCAACGVGYYVVLLALTALFFGGQYHAVGVTALLVIAGSICVGILGGKGEGKRKKSRRNSFYR